MRESKNVASASGALLPGKFDMRSGRKAELSAPYERRQLTLFPVLLRSSRNAWMGTRSNLFILFGR